MFNNTFHSYSGNGKKEKWVNIRQTVLNMVWSLSPYSGMFTYPLRIFFCNKNWNMKKMYGLERLQHELKRLRYIYVLCYITHSSFLSYLSWRVFLIYLYKKSKFFPLTTPPWKKIQWKWFIGVVDFLFHTFFTPLYTLSCH